MCPVRTLDYWWAHQDLNLHLRALIARSTLSNYLYGVTIDPWQPPKEKPPVGHLNENAILRILLLNHFGDTVIYQPAKSLISRT